MSAVTNLGYGEIVKNFSSSDKDYNLWTLLGLTRDAIQRARQKELAQYNISSRQSAVLFIVRAIGDKATPAEISRWLFRESHSISDLLSRMERQGLVRKVKDLDRKNQVRIELTQKGHEVYQQSYKRESIHRILSFLSEEQRKQLGSSLQTLRDKALEEIGVEYEMPFPPSE